MDKIKTFLAEIYFEKHYLKLFFENFCDQNFEPIKIPKKSETKLKRFSEHRTSSQNR